MNLEELRGVVVSGESETIEFKRTTGELVGGMRTVCALLNRRGGFVLFGVGDSGRLSGQIINAKTREEIAQHLIKVEPPAFPDMEEIPLSSRAYVSRHWKCRATRVQSPAGAEEKIKKIPDYFCTIT